MDRWGSRRWTMAGPDSSYSCLVHQRFWNTKRCYDGPSADPSTILPTIGSNDVNLIHGMFQNDWE